MAIGTTFTRIRYAAVLIAIMCLTASIGLRARDVQTEGAVHLRILDDATGELTPARVEVLNDIGQSFIAEDALPISVLIYDQNLENMPDAEWRKSTKSPYTGRPHFYTMGSARLKLPSGKYKIRVFKGPEYYVKTRDVELGDESASVVEIKLHRFVNMPAKGWYSSDGHLHLSRKTRELDSVIVGQMRAEDIHVGNILIADDYTSNYKPPQYAFGDESLYQEGNYILRTGQEGPRTHIFGHAISIGTKERIRARGNYLVYQPVWERAVREGGVNGYGHWGDHFNYNYAPSLGPQLIARHNLMHFIEVLQFNRARYDTWYDMLNLGFRITPTAGTDYVGYSGFPGDERFYARVDGPLRFDTWLDAVRKGRTIVTTGPMLEFRINGKEIGDEIVLQRPGKVTIEGEVRFDPDKDASDSDFRQSKDGDQLFANPENGYVIGLELVQNGDVVRQFPRLGNSGIIKFKIEHDIENSAWLALRTIQLTSDETRTWPPRIKKKAAIAHTAPIFIVLAHSPPISKLPKAKAVARTWSAQLEALKIKFSDDHVLDLQKISDATDDVSAEVLLDSREAVRAEIDAAQNFLKEYLK